MGIFDGLFGKKGPTVYMEASKDAGGGVAVSPTPAVEGSSVPPVVPQAPAPVEVAAQPVNPASLAEGGFVASAPEAEIPAMPVQEAAPAATSSLETQSPTASTMTVEGLGVEPAATTEDTVDYKLSPFASQETDSQTGVVESPVATTTLPVETVIPAAATLNPDLNVVVGSEGVATSFVPPIVKPASTQETSSPILSTPEGLTPTVQEVVETPVQLNPQEGLSNVFNPDGVISQPVVEAAGVNKMVASESTVSAIPETPLQEGTPTIEAMSPQPAATLETPQPVNLAPATAVPQEKVG